jgi:hypothetical protein
MAVWADRIGAVFCHLLSQLSRKPAGSVGLEGIGLRRANQRGGISSIRTSAPPYRQARVRR